VAWSFVGVSSPVVAQTQDITLTEPAGCQAGDLLVACLSYRIASASPMANYGPEWVLVNERNTNNVLTTTSAVASGAMFYCIRGAGAPYLTFSHAATPSQSIGRIVAYRDVNMLTPLDTSAAANTATNNTALSVAGLTTTAARDLIVRAACGGQEATWTAFDAATNPTTSSGTNSNQTADPIVGTWQERADSSSTVGADGSLAIADAIRNTAGATGNFTATASLGASHAHIAGAFFEGPTPGIATPGSSTITQAGSVLEFLGVTGNTGTQSITVPADAQIAVVAVLGRSDDTGFFDTDMTLTKGGADVAMTRVGPTGQTSAQVGIIYYLALPDTGAGKSLKWNWTGTNPPPAGSEPTISVTFWKGIDTAAPVRSVGYQAEVSQVVKSVTGTLTAQNGDLVVAMVGGYDAGFGEGTIDIFYNLNLLSQWTWNDPHDAAWATFAPSGNLEVGAFAATNIYYGVCAAIVLKPAPSPLKAFAVNGTASGTTVTTTIPATAAGDCIIVAGLTHGPYPPDITITAGGQSVVWGTLGGLTSPRYSPHSGGLYNYVGIIINPTAGTTSVVLTSGTSGQHELGCWVVSGLTNPVQDIGVWVPYQIGVDQGDGVYNVSGLSGTLAVADEFAVSFNQAVNNTTSINTSQPGSSGFTSNAIGTPNFASGYSYQITTATTPIQAAWNLDSSGGNTLLATYRSTPPAAPTPPPISFVGFAGRQLFDTTMNLDFPGFPATEAGDCIILAGMVAGSIAGLDIRTPSNDLIAFGTLGGVTSPVLSGSTYSFVGLIANPAVGTTSVNITTTENNSKGMAAWVVRGLTSPVQDKGVWTALDDDPVAVSGLTGTLADANEFAVSLARPPNLVKSANVEQTGSGGFLLDTLLTYFDGGVSHQITESTASIQGAWNSFSGGADVLTATYRSGGGVTGTLTVTDSPDTAVGWTGSVFWNAVLTATDTADTAAFTGTVEWRGILDARDDADTAAFTGEVAWLAILLATDPADIAAFTGDVIPVVEGTLLVTDAPDIADFTGDVVPYTAGILDATDAPDTASFAGTVEWWLVLDATDSPDIAAFTGVILIPLDGILDATDPADVAAFTGQTITYIALDATDQPDTMAFTGLVLSGVGGVLDATEDADTASFASDIINNMVLDATDNPDIAAFTGTVRIDGTLTVTDSADTAAFTGVVTIPVPFTQTTIIG
jgi:hypothetical protein